MNISNTSSLSSSLISRLSQERDQRQEQLASGLRINRAADDPAGLQISSRLTAQQNQFNQEAVNALDQRNINNVQSGQLGSISESLQRANELSIQASNPLSDNSAIQGELDQITEQVNALAEQALGQSGFVSGLSASDPAATQASLEQAFEQVNQAATSLGAESNALAAQASVAQNSAVDIASSRSRIQDTDFAAATSQQRQNEVLLQAAVITRREEDQRRGLLVDQLV